MGRFSSLCLCSTDKELYVQAGDDAASAQWYTVVSTDSGLMLCRNGEQVSAEELAFDHAEVLTAALKKANLI